MSFLRLHAPFAKIDRAARMVYGYASTEALDSHGEIVRRSAVAAALPEFMRFGNIREMHQPSAVGKAKAADLDDKGLYLGVRVVDDAAWKKVTEGVYSGFSIAGRVITRDPASPHIITGCTIDEISLVDRPANPEALFTMYKSDDPAALDSLAKEGRRNSAGDQATIQAIHDQSVALGADCSHDPGEDDPDPTGEDVVAKGGLAVLGRLEKALSRLDAECRRMGTRLAAIEAQPLPARGSQRAVANSDDLGSAARTGGETVHDMIKASLKRPYVT